MEFQKTYNSLGRDTSKGKVEKNDIDGKFLDIIYVMYKASNVSLLYKNNKLLNHFTQLLRKQDEMFNKIFSKLFVSNLPSLLIDTNNGNNKTPNLRNIRLLLFMENLTIFLPLQKELESKSNISKKSLLQMESGIESTYNHLQATATIQAIPTITHHHLQSPIGSNAITHPTTRSLGDIPIRGLLLHNQASKQSSKDLYLVNKARKVWFLFKKFYLSQKRKTQRLFKIANYFICL